MKHYNVLMFGSVPMALDELILAPAIIASVVRNRGHKFTYTDINLSLYDMCGRNQDKYHETVSHLQDINNSGTTDLAEQWLASITANLNDYNLFLLNVFSVMSHGAAWKVIQRVRELRPDLPIMIGGIGSQKKVMAYTAPWTNQYFTDQSSKKFGELLLNNGYIDYWQSTVSTSELEKLLPARLTQLSLIKDVDFSDYEIDNYNWNNKIKSLPLLGSYGCVRECSFCDVIVHFPRYSFIEADHLTKQIVELHQTTKITSFQFMDSLVNGSMSNFLNLLQNLTHAKAQGWLPENFQWSGTYICRPASTQLSKIHSLLKSSGAKTLVIGVETGSDRIRYEMNKKFTNADLINELASLNKQQIKTLLLFFPSWPTETLEDFNDTLDLFRQISKFAHSDTIYSIGLGVTGFSLIPGTPVYEDRDKFQIIEGPTPFLWHCAANPTLTFWETLRRRLTMAAVCLQYGIPLDVETTFLRNMINEIKNNKQTIVGYAGLPDVNKIFKIPDLVSKHTLSFTVVNSNNTDVILTVNNNGTSQIIKCIPGTSVLSFDLIKHIKDEYTITFDFEFDENRIASINQWTNGEYYSANGIIIETVLLDNVDITISGFDTLVNRQWTSITKFQTYDNLVNKRCVPDNSKLAILFPVNKTIRQTILELKNAQLYNEMYILLDRLKRLIVEISS